MEAEVEAGRGTKHAAGPEAAAGHGAWRLMPPVKRPAAVANDEPCARGTGSPLPDSQSPPARERVLQQTALVVAAAQGQGETLQGGPSPDAAEQRMEEEREKMEGGDEEFGQREAAVRAPQHPRPQQSRLQPQSHSLQDPAEGQLAGVASSGEESAAEQRAAKRAGGRAGGRAREHAAAVLLAESGGHGQVEEEAEEEEEEQEGEGEEEMEEEVRDKDLERRGLELGQWPDVGGGGLEPQSAGRLARWLRQYCGALEATVEVRRGGGGRAAGG